MRTAQGVISVIQMELATLSVIISEVDKEKYPYDYAIIRAQIKILEKILRDANE